MRLENTPGSYHLLTKYEKPVVWETKKISSEVNFFSKRFHKLITELEFGEDSSLYSIRHSAVINLYNSPTFDGMNELQITHELMPITRHKSVAGLKNYLQDIKGMIPSDHGYIYTTEI